MGTKTSHVSFISFDVFKFTPLDTLLLQRPCSGWWHFVDGQYFTPSKAWCFGQIPYPYPPCQTNQHEQVSAISQRLHMIVLFAVLSSAPLQEFKGKTAYDRVIWLIHHTHLYSARQKSTRTATLFLTRDRFASASYTLNWSAQLRKTLKYSCTCIYW